MSGVAGVLGTGFGLGLLHSLEPDHLAAMSTLVGRSARSTFADVVTGSTWALGHTLALGLAGAALINAGAEISAGTAELLDVLVGASLVALGLWRLSAARQDLHQHSHCHGSVEHAHYHLHLRKTSHDAPRAHIHHSHLPLWIGILHGLAGSGAVLLVAPAIMFDTLASYLLYVCAFGIGSVWAMAGICAGAGASLGRVRARYRRAASLLAGGAGAVSIGVGAVWLWRVMY